jgi:hypothetical protein
MHLSAAKPREDWKSRPGNRAGLVGWVGHIISGSCCFGSGLYLIRFGLLINHHARMDSNQNSVGRSLRLFWQ